MKSFGGRVLFLDRADINTDEIIPAKYLTEVTKEALTDHLLEDLALEGFEPVRDIPGKAAIVTRDNFGCGSSREHAPLAIKAAGVSCVIADTFARIFFRNGINIGLPLLECAEAVAGISDGDTLEVDLSGGHIRNLTTGDEFRARPYPDFMSELITAGGLIEYTRRRVTARRK